MEDIVFLCHRVPYPPDKGEKIRAWHILQYLARTHRIHLGCLSDEPHDAAGLEALHEICASLGRFAVNPRAQRLRALARLGSGQPLTAGFFYSVRLVRWIDQIFERYRIGRLFVFSSGMAGYAIGRRARLRVLDMVDIDSEKWRAYSSCHRWPMRAIYHREAEALLAFERRAVMEFDATLFVSEAEANHFLRLAPECGDRVGSIENGVDLLHFSPQQRFARPFVDGAEHLVFIGRMDYWPNIDAVVWFAEEVLPLLREGRRRIEFHIVGANPVSRVSALRRISEITVTGRVPDVRPYLRHANVVVAPLRVARGIQNKVLEAMAMGRPVVTTPAGFEGLRAVSGRDLLVCAEAQDMARRICEILDGQHPRLGAAARQAVERNHDWAKTLRPLDALLQGGAGTPWPHPV